MSARKLFLEAEEARRILREHGITDEEAKDLTIESETDLKTLVGQLLEQDREDEATVAFCKTRCQEIKLRAEALELRREKRKTLIAAVLQHIGLEGSLNCGAAGTVHLTSVKPALQVFDETAIPRSYFVPKTTHQLDRVKLGDDVRAGKQIAGATLSNARKTITIRRTST